MANSESAEAMRTAAARFLDGLDDGARTTATFPFGDDGERRDWHYVPRTRNGLSLAAMDATQAELAYRLLATGLSLHGYAAATAIVALEDVLDRIEGGHRHRHRRDYSVTVFDEPHPTEPWGWRFEGHHVSLNVTVVGGEVIGTPLFLGANPAETTTPTGHTVTRPLAAEEDLAFALLATLDPDARRRAQLDHDAPDDVLTTNVPSLDDLDHLLGDGAADAGVRLADLTGDAADAAQQLVHVYLDRLPPDVAGPWSQRIERTWGDVRFAVAGEPAHRRPHYYRLVGPSLLVEYDNTQNDANHVHTVLRDPEGDFGVGLLRHHLDHDHDH
jgi:hypothetical protein